MRGACLFTAVLMPVAAWHLRQSEGWTILTSACIAMAAFALLGFIDTLTARVVIFPERLVVVSNFVRREYARGNFVAVDWAKGCPVSLQRIDGSWFKLPPVGSDARGVSNSLRAWIKRK